MTQLAHLMVACLAIAVAPDGEPKAKATPAPTYHREVARILRNHCQGCHRPGQVAPFSLLTFEQARKRGSDLARMVDERKMPPWHASTTEGGPFRLPRVLSESEIAAIDAWAEAGCPEGDAADAPPPREFSSSWSMGEPDLVITPSRSYTLAAEGGDEFRVFVVPTGLAEGRWLSAVDYRPGNPKVVHHIVAGIDVSGQGRKLDEADEVPGYSSFSGFGFVPFGSLSAWTPGKFPRPLPAGVGRYLPAGSDVLIQIHYHKSGKVEEDATSIGLYFAKAPIDRQVYGGFVFPPRKSIFALRPEMKIPADDANYEVTGRSIVEVDAHAFGIIPHMHWLGKDFKLDAVTPAGARRNLITVDHWDFNWQDTYEFESPVALPAGTRLEMTAHFDNSASNPANPVKPPAPVGWGEQTTDEMCIGALQMTRDDQKLNDAPPPKKPFTALTKPVDLEGADKLFRRK